MKREIRLKSNTIDMKIPLGMGPAVPTDGYGGWDEIARPRGVSMTSWQGHAPLKVDVPVMFNGWPSESVERDVNRLLKLGRTRDGDKEPPVFKVTGPIFFSGTRMVMDGTPDFSPEQIIRNGNGKLVRLAATLHLMEYVKPDRIRLSKRQRLKDSFTWTTKPGDTCLSIAKSVFKDASYAKPIKELNNIRGVRTVLKPGTVLKLPGELPEFGPKEEKK